MASRHERGRNDAQEDGRAGLDAAGGGQGHNVGGHPKCKTGIVGGPSRSHEFVRPTSSWMLSAFPGDPGARVCGANILRTQSAMASQ